MTASQCGIPLFTPSHGNSMSGMDQFLSSAVCLGDLLSSEGYNLNYMGGARLSFAGKGKLFKTHGFKSVLGRDELLPKLENKTYNTGWGLYDDSLFDLAYDRFIELSVKGDKFGLFTLTLDTHHPYGHPSKSCSQVKYKDGSNPILNSVACSDYLITRFVKKIMQSGYAEDTVIVLASDHLALRNTAYDKLKKMDRTNLFMIIDSNVNTSSKVEAMGSTLDIGATLLPFIGYYGDIALGRNLLKQSETEEERIFIQSNLLKWKEPIIKLWDFPKIKSSLEVNVKTKGVTIDNRVFKIPVLIELNDKLESKLKFQFDKSRSHKSLIQHIMASGFKEHFVLIDECRNIRKLKIRELNEVLGVNGFCLLSGKGNRYSKKLNLHSNVKYTLVELKKMLGLHVGVAMNSVERAM